MKTLIVAALFAGAALALTPLDADAKRLGGGKSQGMQRDMPARTAPDAAPGKPAAPAQASPQATPGTPAGAPAAAAAPAKRSWMGPLAGLAAGLGLAALFSSLGMSGAMGSLLLMVLLAVAAFFVIRLVMRRMSPQTATASPVSAYSGSPQAGGTQVAWPQPGGSATGTSAGGSAALAPQALAPVAEAPAATADAPVAAVSAPVAKAFVPAAFDSVGFERAAKLIFIRMQAANDTADLEDLRSFTTPELFAAIRLDLQERGDAKQTTDVVQVNAQVLDVTQEGDKQVVSVRFHGEVREDAGAAPTAFNEVWHLVKPLDDSRSWAVAGIEQMN